MKDTTDALRREFKRLFRNMDFVSRHPALNRRGKEGERFAEIYQQPGLLWEFLALHKIGKRVLQTCCSMPACRNLQTCRRKPSRVRTSIPPSRAACHCGQELQGDSSHPRTRGLRLEAELALNHPQLTLGEVYSALAYYADHREQVDRELVTSEAEAEKMHAEPRHRRLAGRLKRSP